MSIYGKKNSHKDPFLHESVMHAGMFSVSQNRRKLKEKVAHFWQINFKFSTLSLHFPAI